MNVAEYQGASREKLGGRGRDASYVEPEPERRFVRLKPFRLIRGADL